MYDVSKKREATRELQRLLLELSYTDPRLIGVAVDGDFSERTAEAVLTFQHHYGLDESGIVDLLTWEAIAERGLRAERERLASASLQIPSGLPLTVGAVGHPVLVLQSALGELGEVYSELPRVAATGSYRDGTAYAVSLLQRKYGLRETGVTDAETWMRIMRDRDTRDKISYELNR